MDTVNHEDTVKRSDQDHESTCNQKRSFDLNDLLTDAEVTAYLGLGKGTLTQWRHKGTGPTYIKLGACVRYRYSDLLEYINKQRSNQ